MAGDKTTVTELVTGLATLGFADVESALAARPDEMVSLSREQWDLLAELHRGGLYRQEFLAAWQNGAAFLAAADGLRRRRPLLVEWRGAQKQPGDEPVPADLRIDHVFLVSCKYLSHIVTNTSPTAVFDRLLAGGHGGRSGDWFAEVAPEAYQVLYDAVRAHCLDAVVRSAPGSTDHPDGLGSRGRGPGEVAAAADRRPQQCGGAVAPSLPLGGSDGLHRPQRADPADLADLPASVTALTPAQRSILKQELGSGQWAMPLRPAALVFAEAVSEASAARWRAALAGADRERVLWRLLRIGAAPYFVLGASPQGSLRLRIGTAWDWRQHFRIEDFAVAPGGRAQPVVQWRVVVAHRRSAQRTTIDGHVEIRWSHGKFAQPPEAKVYLDTPHTRVPGYWPLT